MTMMNKRLGFGVVLVGVLALAACGGDSGSSGEKVSVDVSAEAGGEVEVGAAKLTIPAGALAEDTTITAESKSPSGLPDSATLTGLQYDFGPDGLTFLAPVTLELPVGTVPSGKEAVISWLDESTNTWHDETTTAAAGKVSADIMHFTTFIVRFRDAGAVDCSFASCGGDVVGTWDIQGVCVTLGEENPFEQSCPTATIELVVDGNGTVTFNADLTYSVTINLTGDMTIVFPAACVTGAPSCDGLLGDEFTCTGSPSSGCTCVQALNQVNENGGTYATAGSQITFHNTGDPEPQAPSDYCVADTQLKVSRTEPNGNSFVYTAVRAP
jgi:hypothetical protein